MSFLQLESSTDYLLLESGDGLLLESSSPSTPIGRLINGGLVNSGLVNRGLVG